MKKNIGLVCACLGSVSVATVCAFTWMHNSTLKTELNSLHQAYSNQKAMHQREIERLESLLSEASSEKAAVMAIEPVITAIADQKPESPCANVAVNSADKFVENMESFHISEAVLNKYKTLLDIVEVGSQEEQVLLELLAQRERVLNMVSHSYFTDPLDSELAVQQRDEKLSELDDKIAAVLEPGQFDDYQLLKDSGFEQHQVQEFDAQLPADELLTEHQSNNLLLAKLMYKDSYQLSIQEASQLVKSGEKEKGFKLFESAIESYQTNYLNEARGELTDTQFEKLKSFEEVRFSAMLLSLKAPYEDYALD